MLGQPLTCDAHPLIPTCVASGQKLDADTLPTFPACSAAAMMFPQTPFNRTGCHPPPPFYGPPPSRSNPFAPDQPPSSSPTRSGSFGPPLNGYFPPLFNSFPQHPFIQLSPPPPPPLPQQLCLSNTLAETACVLDGSAGSTGSRSTPSKDAAVACAAPARKAAAVVSGMLQGGALPPARLENALIRDYDHQQLDQQPSLSSRPAPAQVSRR